MSPELKEKWVAALESGGYKQTTGFLRKNGEGFCCLGVLCDVMDRDAWKQQGDSDSYFHPMKHRKKDEYLDSDVLLEIGMTDVFMRQVAEMNDGNDSFDAIAMYIRENL